MTEMGGIETGVIDLTDIIGEVQVPCDYSSLSWCSKQHAQWVGFLSPCGCGMGGQRLLCESCHDVVTTTPDGFECRACGEVTMPARLAYAHFERIDKRP